MVGGKADQTIDEPKWHVAILCDNHSTSFEMSLGWHGAFNVITMLHLVKLSLAGNVLPYVPTIPCLFE